MSLLQNSNAISAGGYDINNSLRFRSSGYLSKAYSSSGTIDTWSFWIKRGKLGSVQTIFGTSNGVNQSFGIEFTSSDTIQVYDYLNAFRLQLYTTQVFRDPSAWYHIVLAIDTTQATAANRAKFYVNGTQVTAFSTATYPTINQSLNIGSVLNLGIGITGNIGGQLYDGYMTEWNFIDGQALTPSSFGETDPVTGSWVAKKYTGTYGINGFYLPFSDTESNENLSLGSQTIGGSYWSNVNVTATVNNTVAPDGTTTASRLQATAADSATYTSLNGLNSGQTYTWSVYLKADSTTSISLLVDKNGSGTAGYETLPITVTTSWQRFSVTFIPASTTSALLIGGGVTFSSPEVVYAWGSQVNHGTIARKYIVTTASQVTNQGTIENLLTYSEQFDNAVWAKANVTATANTIVAPNGSTTADTLFETAVTGEHYTERVLTPTTNTQYVFSTYAKYLNRKYLALRIVYNNGANDTITIFDIQNGTYYGYEGSAPTATSITSVGNGWYRISVTFTTPATNPTASLLFRHQFRDDSGSGGYAGNASVGTYLWGAQVETQGTLGPYLSTVASAQSLVHRIGTDRSLGSTSFGYNTWIPTNISLTQGTTYDAMIDSPTLTSATVANYAVLNPLAKNASLTIQSANLQLTSGSVNVGCKVTIPVSSGKWYMEYQLVTNGLDPMVGIILDTFNWDFGYVGNNANGWGYSASGVRYTNTVSTAYGASYVVGDIIGLALDMDTGSLTCYKNNVSQGVLVSGLSVGSNYSFAFSVQNNTIAVNFGQRPFSYTPPTGFKALNTYNLPNSTILKGNKYMDATTYTGNSVSPTSITNAASFKPDFVWIKNRSSTPWHNLTDSNRGANITLFSNASSAESSNEANGYLSAFNNNGFALTTGSTSFLNVNTTSNNYVAWQWQAGQGTTSTNTAGSITSTVSANPTAGFSIVTFTGNATAGSTVGHGLGVAPKFVIYKARNNGNDWWSYHVGLTSAAYAIQLNTINAQNNTVNFFNSTAPSASVLTLGYWNNVTGFNLSTQNYVAYCWAEIAGFSKFGSYTGNGSADGPFVYLGFRPKFVLFKRSDAAGNWYIFDTVRGTYNINAPSIFPNRADAELASTILDVLSNGFKIRSSASADWNANGGTYIYMAFAENPFKNSNAR